MKGTEISRFKDGAVVRFLRRPGGVEVVMGESVWEETSPHRLRAKIRKEANAGRIARVAPIVEDAYGAWAVVLPQTPPHRGPWYAVVIGTALGAVVGLGSMIWYNRWAALAAAVTVVALIAAMRSITRYLARRHVCPGLHCPGPH